MSLDNFYVPASFRVFFHVKLIFKDVYRHDFVIAGTFVRKFRVVWVDTPFFTGINFRKMFYGHFLPSWTFQLYSQNIDIYASWVLFQCVWILFEYFSGIFLKQPYRESINFRIPMLFYLRLLMLNLKLGRDVKMSKILGFSLVLNCSRTRLRYKIISLFNSTFLGDML